MLGVLGIFALLATTGTYAMEFTEEVFRQAFPVEDKPIAAKIINAQRAIPLHRPTYDGRNGIIFYSDPSPPPQPIDLPPKMKDFYCVDNNGIFLRFQHQIPDQLVGCKIVSFRCVAQLYHGNSAVTYFIIYFQYGYEGPVGLIVPVFEKPSQGTPQTLKLWAEQHKLGLVDPAILKTFSDAYRSEPASLSFQWLDSVLPYGVFKNKRQLSLSGKKVKTFVTRPVLFPKVTIKAFLYDILSVKRKNAEAGVTTSNVNETKLADTNLTDSILYDYGLGRFKSDETMFVDNSLYDQAIADDALLKEAIIKETGPRTPTMQDLGESFTQEDWRSL